MKDCEKSQGQLIEELEFMRRRVAAIEQRLSGVDDAAHKRAEEAKQEKERQLDNLLSTNVDAIILEGFRGMIHHTQIAPRFIP